ncbi:MAG TPA: FliH/SctL family protein [Stellaceae bacterium]|nr:FliH/SctL family protein [Stellaceae bacterium]
MAAPTKYLFERSFDNVEQPRPVSRKPPPEPPVSRAEFEAARSAAFADGRKSGLAEAAHSAEERTAAALTKLAADIQALLALREECSADVERRAIEAMRAIMRKAVPALCRKDPLAEIEAVLDACLHEAFEEPRIVLRVADAQFEPVQSRLSALAQAAGYAGKLVLLADNDLGPGDVRIEWAEGGAERQVERLMSDIDAALSRALDATNTVPAKPLEESKERASRRTFPSTSSRRRQATPMPARRPPRISRRSTTSPCRSRRYWAVPPCR